MAFKDILGHDKIITWLQRAKGKNRLAGSYLFIGKEGIGKKLVALNLAKVLNCLAPQTEVEAIKSDACEKCLSCQKINSGIHPDVILIEPERESIKIDQIRHLKHILGLKPAFATKRVVIIDNAQFLTSEAANAFLKTLEEPPLNSVLILIAQDKTQLPPTIVSRCQIIRFSPLPLKIVAKMLKKGGFEEKIAKFLASISDGSPGRAMALAERMKEIELLFPLLKPSSVKDALAGIERLLKAYSDDIYAFLDLYQGLLRDVLFLKQGLDEFVINKDRNTLLKGLVAKMDSQEIYKKMSFLHEAQRLIQQNIQKKSILESLVLYGE